MIVFDVVETHWRFLKTTVASFGEKAEGLIESQDQSGWFLFISKASLVNVVGPGL